MFSDDNNNDQFITHCTIEEYPLGWSSPVHFIYYKVSSFLLPHDSHICNAGIGSHSCTVGPSIDTWIKWSCVPVFNRLRCAVFICFMLENTLSVVIKTNHTP